MQILYHHAHLRAALLQGRDEILGMKRFLFREDDDPIGEADGSNLALSLHLTRPLGVLRLVRRKLPLHDDLLSGQDASLQWRNTKKIFFKGLSLRHAVIICKCCFSLINLNCVGGGH